MPLRRNEITIKMESFELEMSTKLNEIQILERKQQTHIDTIIANQASILNNLHLDTTESDIQVYLNGLNDQYALCMTGHEDKVEKATTVLKWISELRETEVFTLSPRKDDQVCPCNMDIDSPIVRCSGVDCAQYTHISCAGLETSPAVWYCSACPIQKEE